MNWTDDVQRGGDWMKTLSSDTDGPSGGSDPVGSLLEIELNSVVNYHCRLPANQITLSAERGH